ncbi:hypothetical protein BLNAU_17996 [Blattamonas nauphoetae]|uniref:Uncharacterized protein n=1 Tax=Blattamonas nauphoetae TaxID=2049346 RepID=A0ABQ9X656_9EUKA|nr:hypothetical protein BLNAU_17996 [Blattamonas nauphoetae]
MVQSEQWSIPPVISEGFEDTIEQALMSEKVQYQNRSTDLEQIVYSDELNFLLMGRRNSIESRIEDDTCPRRSPSPLHLRNSSSWMFDHESSQPASSISLLGVTHLSKTSTLPPLVGLLHSYVMQSSSTHSDLNDVLLDSEADVTIVGMGLVFDSTSFSAGTGPLFSFGLAEEPSLVEIVQSLRMETTLIGSSLVNVTSRRLETRKEQLFGGEVSQRVIGSEIDQSTNHNSGTAMMDGNLGGNIRCVNTSFSECRREVNSDESFINKNITSSAIGRKVFDASCTATLISYSLCTFKDMYIAAGGGRGGAAIYIYYAAASLSVKDCFLLRCQCTAQNDDGGAICIAGTSKAGQYFQLERSSLSECKSIGTDNNYGGSIFVMTVSVTISDSFFEKSTTLCDGAITLYSDTHSILSNCAFVLCSATARGGAVGIYYTATVSFSFVQFRGCKADSHPSSRDVSFFTLTRAQVSEEMFKHCDSTSGSPNVYFVTGSTSDSNLIKQTSPDPSISLTIDFDEDQQLATVTVTASKAIGGTMGILLNGLIVPRVIHAVFGTDTEPSQTGTAVVSSGPNGILPKAPYSPLNHSVSSSLIPPPTVLNCECSVNDANTSLVVVSGWCLEEGNYVITVKKGQDGDEKEIWLTRMNSRTLQGTAVLYPSTVQGQLDWDSEYEVISIARRTENEDIQLELLRTMKFTTPSEPIRIEKTKCSLGGEKDKAGVVEFWGVGLSPGKGYALKVKKEESEGVVSGEEIGLTGTLSSSSESGSFFHSEEIFGSRHLVCRMG